MAFNNPELNKFFNTLCDNQKNIIGRKRYDESDHDPSVSPGSDDPSARALRGIAMLDKAFDQLMYNTFVLGAKITGGRNPTQ